ncbi:MAG: type II toxin-antitoxin system antitoxin, RelB/DinJ family [Epsilonproteobacteria bacterium]|nr:MAG: type II toxin-antitoxin system antitoxin, RelB/DinJ family [Campylobacterota bacterium]
MNTIPQTIQVDENIYTQANNILNKIGLDYTQAISVFNNLIVQNRGLPFELKLPNKDTTIALDELKHRRGKSFDTIDELFDDLDK